MRRLLVILFLFCQIVAFAQLTPKKVSSVPNATATFVANVAKDDIIINDVTGEQFVCITATSGTYTLTTASANFTKKADYSSISNLTNNLQVALKDSSIVAKNGGYPSSKMFADNLALKLNLSQTTPQTLGSTTDRLLKGWATDIESTNMPTVGGVSLATIFFPHTGGRITGATSLSGTAYAMPAFSFDEGTTQQSYIKSISADANYKGLGIYYNSKSNGDQFNTSLPSWMIDLGNLETIGSDGFAIRRKAAGGTSWSDYLFMSSLGVASFVSDGNFTGDLGVSGGKYTGKTFNFQDGGNIKSYIRSNVADVTYNGLYIVNNEKLDGTQFDPTIQSWSVDLGGIGGGDKFTVNRRAVGGSWISFFNLSNAGVLTNSGNIVAPNFKFSAGSTAGYGIYTNADGSFYSAPASTSQVFRGAWSASANSPTLTNATGTTGDWYRATTAGTVNFGAGNITFAVNDEVHYNGTNWFWLPGVVFTLNTASPTVLGGIKVGTGITMTGDVASVSTAYDATGTASGLLSTHNLTYNHSHIATAYGWGNHAGLYVPITGGNISGNLGINGTTYSRSLLTFGNSTSGLVTGKIYEINADVSYKGLGIYHNIKVDGTQSNTAIPSYMIDLGGIENIGVNEFAIRRMITGGTSWINQFVIAENDNGNMPGSLTAKSFLKLNSSNDTILLGGGGSLAKTYFQVAGSYQPLATVLTNTTAAYTTTIDSRLTNTSGTNTGDNAVNSLYSGLVTFPGFGTSHSLSAYGDHNHSGVYEVPLTFSTGLTRTGNTITNNITQYTNSDADARVVAGITGKQNTITTGTTLQYFRGDLSLATMPTTLPASDVYAWAKASVKPSYSATEIGLSNVTNNAQWYSGNHPTTTSDYGLPTYPTTLPASDVYSWAKAATKPTYTYSEVGALASGGIASNSSALNGHADTYFQTALLSNVPHSYTANTSFTFDLSTYVNCKISTNTAINCTISNMPDGGTGQIEVTYTGAAIVTIIVDSGYAIIMPDGVWGSTTNAYTKAIASFSSGVRTFSYYRSGNNVTILGMSGTLH